MTNKKEDSKYIDPILLESDFFKCYKEYKWNNSHLIWRWFGLLFLLIVLTIFCILIIWHIVFDDILVLIFIWFSILFLLIVALILARVILYGQRDILSEELIVIYSCFSKFNLNNKSDYKLMKQLFKNSIDSSTKTYNFFKIIVSSMISLFAGMMLNKKGQIFEKLYNIINQLNNEYNLNISIPEISYFTYVLCIALFIFLAFIIFYYWPNILSWNLYWKQQAIYQIDKLIINESHGKINCISEIDCKPNPLKRFLSLLRKLLKKIFAKKIIYIEINHKVIYDNKSKDTAKISTSCSTSNNKS